MQLHFVVQLNLIHQEFSFLLEIVHLSELTAFKFLAVGNENGLHICFTVNLLMNSAEISSHIPMQL